MLETITLVGALAGLVTFAFTLWDRWLRGRPLAWLTVTIRTGGTPADPCIHIKNPGPSDLLIQRVRARPTSIYSVAKDHSIKAISAAALEGIDVNLLLPPGQEHDLAIVDRRVGVQSVQNNVSQRVRFSVYWRKTSSTWLPQFPVVIHTSTHDIQRIIDAAHPNRSVFVGVDGGLELPLKLVQARLEHASIQMTADVYGHLFPRSDDGAELAAAEKAFLGA